MPELPEVETVRRGLQELIVGKKFVGVQVYESPKSFPNTMSDARKFLINAQVVTVRRRAKVLLIDLNSDYTLVTHLKMTGQLIYVSPQQRWGAGHPNNSFLHELPDKSTRVEFVFSDDSRLYFNDQRKFGWVKLVPTVEVENIDFMRRVGPEPLEDAFTAQQFILRLHRRRNTTIKAAILDQTVLAGVGNIYADESLWGAKIHPATRVRDVSDTQLTKLLTEIKSVMILSIEKGGSTDKNYRDAEGRKGSYLSFARVFRREGKACPRCGSVIEKLRVAGRGTHICPVCQKLPVH
ncbi:MAG TPA: bifunctional DNA-formamidopyrimidine glycosylase/DNA-(apurinic or apyrimidinic site) lyase [Candidatus Saccharibacteria bacterium]|nr:bifunctional DNA-formamidopyrimidine glycosylase/DNA-(apurinic or apyrimidinic site) lyase [Candidatus Saccharibacteria bacterium]